MKEHESAFRGEGGFFTLSHFCGKAEEMENVDADRRTFSKTDDAGDKRAADDDERSTGGHTFSPPSPPLAQGAKPLKMYSVRDATPTATTTILCARVVRSSYSK